MIKVSVIVSVYNAGQYLIQCLDSLKGQTLQDIEIICIDDGSTDDSSRILDEYAADDNRIRVVHKENEGLVATRKEGVRLAAGAYIGYVDSDDWVESEMYERLYEKAEETQADLVTSGYLLEGNYTTVHYDTIPEGVYGEKRIKYLRDHTIYCLKEKETGLRATLCSKLFRADMMKKVQQQIPNGISIAEDKMCVLTYVLECTSVYVMKKAYYHYCIHFASMVHSSDTEYLFHIHEVYSFLCRLYRHPNFTDTMRTQAELYITELLINGLNQRMGFKNRNLLWVDPYWLDQFPKNARIVLYGGGELGRKYKRQIEVRGEASYIGCIDYGYGRYTDKELQVKNPVLLKGMEYDFIIITIKNQRKAEEIKEQLIKDGVLENKILWFEQKEIFWKFAEAEGLLETEEQNEA